MATEFAELQGHDAYSLLGVAPDATSEQIQRSYRRLMKSVHPDLNAGDDDVTGHAALLNAARKVLLTRRVAYDEFRRRPVATPKVELPPEPQPQPPQPASPQPSEPEYFPYTTSPSRRRPAPVQWSSGRKATPPRRKSRRRIRVVPLLLAVLAIAAAITFFARNAANNEPDPQPSVAVPAKLAGTWKGTLKSANDKGFAVELTLTAGKTNGKVHYATGDGCDGAAVPTTTWKQALVFDTAFDADGCDLGNLYVTATSPTKLSVELHEQDKTLTGTLTKSGH